MTDTSILDLMKSLKSLLNPSLTPQEITSRFKEGIAGKLIDLNITIETATPEGLFAVFKYDQDRKIVTAYLYERINHKTIVLLIEGHNNSIEQ